MRRKWMYLLAALIVLTLTVGCTVTFDSGGSWGSYTLSGEVTSADRSEGIPNVRIHFSDTSIPETTDFYGEWSRGFNGGDLTIRAERRGFIFKPDAYRLYDLDRSRYDLDFTVTGFIDDFTYTDTGWANQAEPEGGGGYYYTNSEYQIDVTEDLVILMTVAPVSISRDYTVQVRGYLYSGSGYFGLVFNWISWDSYYYVFRINPDTGNYQLIRVNADGSKNTLVNLNSSAITEGITNLKLDQNSGKVTINVNSTRLLNQYDISPYVHPMSSYLSVGLYGYNDGNSSDPTDCRFDDFGLFSAVIVDSSMLKANSLNGKASTHKDVEN